MVCTYGCAVKKMHAKFWLRNLMERKNVGGRSVGCEVNIKLD
jgi:hypothetical protein